jgi:hypothetical protein
MADLARIYNDLDDLDRRRYLDMPARDVRTLEEHRRREWLAVQKHEETVMMAAEASAAKAAKDKWRSPVTASQTKRRSARKTAAASPGSTHRKQPAAATLEDGGKGDAGAYSLDSYSPLLRTILTYTSALHTLQRLTRKPSSKEASQAVPSPATSNPTQKGKARAAPSRSTSAAGTKTKLDEIDVRTHLDAFGSLTLTDTIAEDVKTIARKEIHAILPVCSPRDLFATHICGS